MRRRQTVAGTPKRIPRKLRTFVPADWPGATVYRQHEAWWAEVEDHLERYPDDIDHIQIPGDIPWDPAIDPP